jgi:hypothetical protein
VEIVAVTLPAASQLDPPHHPRLVGERSDLLVARERLLSSITNVEVLTSSGTTSPTNVVDALERLPAGQ